MIVTPICQIHSIYEVGHDEAGDNGYLLVLLMHTMGRCCSCTRFEQLLPSIHESKWPADRHESMISIQIHTASIIQVSTSHSLNPQIYHKRICFSTDTDITHPYPQEICHLESILEQNFSERKIKIYHNLEYF